MVDEMQKDAAFASAWPRAAALGCGYFVCAAVMMAFTRFDGGIASLWIATALLVAELATADRPRWWASIATCVIASFTAIVVFGFGFWAAFPLVVINIGEAMLGAALLRMLGRADDYLESLPGVGAMTVAAGLLAPAIAALAGAAVASQTSGQAYGTQYLTWLAGHGLGTITFTPIFALILSGEAAASVAKARARDRIEAILLMATIVLVSIAVFGQDRLPLLFLPMLPLTVITFRLERMGAAIAIVGLALIGGALTVFGHGPIARLAGSMADHARLFQFYLAITVLTILPVAAELRQRRNVLSRLAESEARFKLITESATDMIVTLDTEGLVRYVSPSVREVTGFDPAEMIGLRPHALGCGPDKATMALAIARAQALGNRPSIVEYRAATASGELRWFEAHTRGTQDADGNPNGWVSAIRDISERKALELKLAHAATTDPLTGLANRRRFDAIVDRLIEDRRTGAGEGCIALFDIDFFKRVNDDHGHAVGDLVLETFANAALRTVRAGDHVARLGGEEFGIILESVSLDQAALICDRVRYAVARDVTRTPGGDNVSVTVSAGLVAITQGQSRLQLMRAADEALYRAKAAGRDRVALAA